jgi:REP element-mobilizing transposase RayT
LPTVTAAALKRRATRSVQLKIAGGDTRSAALQPRGKAFAGRISVSLRRPQRLRSFDYRGPHQYFVTCRTVRHRKLFADASIVGILGSQVLRTCDDRGFEAVAYVFLEDHVHLLLRGLRDDSLFKPTMTLLRQRTAIAYRRSRGSRSGRTATSTACSGPLTTRTGSFSTSATIRQGQAFRPSARSRRSFTSRNPPRR